MQGPKIKSVRCFAQALFFSQIMAAFFGGDKKNLILACFYGTTYAYYLKAVPSKQNMFIFLFNKAA
jgi:hypothetical protein